MEPWMEIMWAIIVGILAGLIAAFIGYVKGTTIEKFSPYKMTLTLVIGGVVGAIGGYQGLDVMVPANFDEIYKMLLDAGLIGVINWIVLAVWRRSGLAEKYGDGEETPAPEDPDIEAAINNNTPKEPETPK
jgi:hypothetical protein